MNTLRMVAMALILLVLGAASGCGGSKGDQDAGTSAPDTEAPGGGGTEIRLDEYSLDPSDVKVRQGDTIKVVNDGDIAHNLTIEKGPDAKKKTDELAGTSTFLGGGSEDLKVDLKPGTYAIVCTVPGHRALGMVGTITVR